MTHASTASGFHRGELAVQERAGVRDEAARLSGMLAPAHLSGGASGFLAQRDLVILTARDRDGRLWTSPLAGPRGFVDAHDTSLHVDALPGAGDPLVGLPDGRPVGMLAIDFATHRRMRVNGTLVSAGPTGLQVDVDQAYGNCPQYIQQRHLSLDPSLGTPGAGRGQRSDAILPNHARVISQADTFFLGTTHPTRGTDASHRGGAPGFARVSGPDLWWPDYPGNNMFNSLGNIAVDPTAALLFLDFITGVALHLSGTATIEWTTPAVPGDDGGTGRRVHFAPEQVVATTTGLRAADLARYPRNPRLT